nr:FH1/FH2 domain-containing protein 3-like isoform X2 [Columba livia]
MSANLAKPSEGQENRLTGVSVGMLDDCTLQLSHNGTYLDLESTLAEQRDELEGFQEDAGRGKKHSIILRTQLSVRVHACIGHVMKQPFWELELSISNLQNSSNTSH